MFVDFPLPNVCITCQMPSITCPKLNLTSVQCLLVLFKCNQFVNLLQVFIAIGISVFVFLAVLLVTISLIVRHYRQKVTRSTHHVTFSSNSSQRPLLNSDNHVAPKTQPHQMTAMPLTSMKIVENPAYQTKNPICGSSCKCMYMCVSNSMVFSVDCIHTLKNHYH